MSDKSVIGRIVDLGLLDDCKMCPGKDERIAELARALHDIDNWGIEAPVDVDVLAWVRSRIHTVLGDTNRRIAAGEIKPKDVTDA